MANGDTTNRTHTPSKLNKNNNTNTQDATNAVNHSTASNRASANEKTTSGSGGRVRRRSAPPVTLEGRKTLY